MEEADDSLDDWRDLMLSPKGLFSGFFSQTDDVKVEALMSNSEENLREGEIGTGSMVDDSNTLTDSGGSIAEKRAVRFGFNASKINSPRLRSSSPLASAAARSPCLTIPAGISPTALLDSPILLPNSQLSPTTGTLKLPPADHDNPLFKSTSYPADKGQDGDDASSFRLKTPASPASLSCYPPPQNQVHSIGNLTHSFKTEVDCQSLVPVQPSTVFEYPAQQNDPTPKNSDFESPADSKIPYGIAMMAKSAAFQLSSHSNGMPDNEMRDTAQIMDAGGGRPLDGFQKGLNSSLGTQKTSEDGYNWRKYGQKQVKGSEYPRSYYKCTQPSCPVKKKVERSHDGEITEIIYKGAHNHPKPQPSRRSTFGLAVPCGESTETGEGSGSCVNTNLIRGDMQQSYNENKVGPDWRSDGLDITSSTSVVTEVLDPNSSNQKPVGVLESAETPELSSTLASHGEEEEDTTTQGSLSVGEDDDVETDSKRRKKESSLIDTTLGSRALREPRVIVQIESEVDIVEDGYRWRKYGQKVVKGNPNPRSYYKCTSAGCTVRKHVERASHNLKYVLTTYEGKHNHAVPASRNSSHMNSGGANMPPSAANSNSQSTLTLPRNSHLPKPEPEDFIPPFDRKMEYGSEFLRPNYLGSFSGASSSLYHMKFPAIPMKFPAIPSSAICGAFGLNPNCVPSAPPIIPTVRDLSIPLPLNFSLPSSFAMASYNNLGRPLNPIPPFFMGQQLKEGEIKLLRPKQEQKDESYGESSITTMDCNNAASPATVYHNTMGSFSS